MRRVEDYRENARACRDLARKMPAAHREQLLTMAEQWDRLAAERAAELAAQRRPPSGTDDR